MTTVTYVKRLRPYFVGQDGSFHDQLIWNLYQQEMTPPQLEIYNEYSRGCYDKDRHYEALAQYQFAIEREKRIIETMKSDTIMQQSIQDVISILSPLKTTQHFRYKIHDVPFTASSGSGFGYIGKKGINLDKAVDNAYRALRDYYYYKDQYWFVPYKAYARTQLSTIHSPKLRLVWGAPFHTILLEQLVADPLYLKIMSEDTPIYIGRNMFRCLPGSLTRLVNDHEKPWYYCLDFKAFDANASSAFIDAAWYIIRKLVVSVDDLSYDYIEQGFKKIPLLMPNGDLYYVTTGVPSGSMFTQIIDSIINLIYITYVQNKLFRTLSRTYVLGDDSVFSSDEYIDIEEIAKCLHPYGAILNIRKSVITQDHKSIQFLGHNYNGSLLTRDDFILSLLALYSEYPIQGVSHSATRIASLLYDANLQSNFMYNLYKKLLSTYPLDDSSEFRPIDVEQPYSKIFNLL